MAAADILNKNVKLRYIRSRLTDLDQIWQVTRMGTPDHTQP